MSLGSCFNFSVQPSSSYGEDHLRYVELGWDCFLVDNLRSSSAPQRGMNIPPLHSVDIRSFEQALKAVVCGQVYAVTANTSLNARLSRACQKPWCSFWWNTAYLTAQQCLYYTCFMPWMLHILFVWNIAPLNVVRYSLEQACWPSVDRRGESTSHSLYHTELPSYSDLHQVSSEQHGEGVEEDQLLPCLLCHFGGWFSLICTASRYIKSSFVIFVIFRLPSTTKALT